MFSRNLGRGRYSYSSIRVIVLSIDIEQLSAYINETMRRKPGKLLQIETSILEAGVAMQIRGASEFYGFQIAKEMADSQARRRLTAYGTLYRALNRMEGAGLLVSSWEDPRVAADAHRPIAERGRRCGETTRSFLQAISTNRRH